MWFLGFELGHLLNLFLEFSKGDIKVNADTNSTVLFNLEHSRLSLALINKLGKYSQCLLIHYDSTQSYEDQCPVKSRVWGGGLINDTYQVGLHAPSWNYLVTFGKAYIDIVYIK